MTGALNGKLLDVERRTVECMLDMLSESSYWLNADEVLNLIVEIYQINVLWKSCIIILEYFLELDITNVNDNTNCLAFLMKRIKFGFYHCIEMKLKSWENLLFNKKNCFEEEWADAENGMKESKTKRSKSFSSSMVFFSKKETAMTRSVKVEWESNQKVGSRKRKQMYTEGIEREKWRENEKSRWKYAQQPLS